MATVDASGNVLQRYVYGTRINVPDYMVAGGTTYRIVANHLGSVRLVVDATTGTVAQRIDYEEFGNVTLDTNPGFQPFGYAGGLYDPDTGLVRFGARDYDPETGRWTAKDPILFGGGQANLYVYVGGDPLSWVDISGREPVPPDDAGRSTPEGGTGNGTVFIDRIPIDNNDNSLLLPNPNGPGTIINPIWICLLSGDCPPQDLIPPGPVCRPDPEPVEPLPPHPQPYDGMDNPSY